MLPFYCNQIPLIEDPFFLAILFLCSFFITHTIITQIGRENKFSADLCLAAGASPRPTL